MNQFATINFLQELSTWKTRRRKQSEDAFQRVAEVKALEDSDTGEPRKMYEIFLLYNT
jgi:hypothetical protein